MKQRSWMLEDEEAEYIMQVGGKNPSIGLKKVVEFYKEHIGREADIAVQAAAAQEKVQELSAELKKMRDTVQEKMQIYEVDLKKREGMLKEKEAIWLVVKKLMRE